MGGKDLHTLHSCRNLAGSEEIVEGVFWGADVTEASAMVAKGKVTCDDWHMHDTCTHANSRIACTCAPSSI